MTSEPTFTLRAKLFADGARGYHLQVFTVLADGVDTGIDRTRKCEKGVWTTTFDSDLGSFPSLSAALTANEQRRRDDEWEAAAP